MSDDCNYILIDVDWRFPAPKARKRYVPVERAENAETAISRVREQLHKPWKYECECCTRIWIALDGDGDE